MKFSAVLLDLDGTLVCTIDLWIEAYQETFRQVGVTMTREDFLQKIYEKNKRFVDALEEESGITDPQQAKLLRMQRDAYYVELLRTKPLWIDGAEALIAALKQRYPVAIVTGSHESYVDAIDSQIRIRSSLFSSKNEPEGD